MNLTELEHGKLYHVEWWADAKNYMFQSYDCNLKNLGLLAEVGFGSVVMVVKKTYPYIYCLSGENLISFNMNIDNDLEFIEVKEDE